MSRFHYITRRFEFDSAHRVLQHESKCRHIHGHRYKLELTLRCPNLDKLGRVLDFSEVKRAFGDWIDRYWDHNVLLNPDDPLTGLWRGRNVRVITQTLFQVRSQISVCEDLRQIFGGKEPYVMPSEFANPTAENMASHFFSIAQDSILPTISELSSSGLVVHRVRLYETPNCWADSYGIENRHDT